MYKRSKIVVFLFLAATVALLTLVLACYIETNSPGAEVSFYLFYNDSTSKNISSIEVILAEDSSNLEEIPFDLKLPTKIIVHGFNSDMSHDSLTQIRNEYLAKHPVNVIAVDWSQFSCNVSYNLAVKNVDKVGEKIAKLVRQILEVDANSDLHVIGFSLGAQVAAAAARFLRPYELTRITGLDPAMPWFVTNGEDFKLDASDAEFVDVYHTNAMLQGKVERCGHVDFYFNGGIVQPGCRGWNLIGCSHERAPEYFAESINSKLGFWGWKCRSFLSFEIGNCSRSRCRMLFLAGDSVNRRLRGVFMVTTNDDSPFALGNYSKREKKS